ncbi:glycerophosphodiester phosphodiesterase family protein [Oscillibacter valericigenes]|nr:glycerophosphodiester phosphodiesterase family protein [Oscillibacter valericigenes]
MKQLLKRSADISLKNLSTLLLFDIVYKVFSYSILYAVTSDLLSLILKAAGLSYLSTENLYIVFMNPLTIILCICMMLLITFSVFFETVALYTYCESGWKQERISIAALLKRTLLQCKKLLQVENVLLFFGFVLTKLLTILPFSPYILQWLGIPEFVMDFITQNPLLLLIYGLAALTANFVCFLFLLILPDTLFYDQSIKMAWKEGMQRLRNKKAVTVFRALGAFLIFGAAAMAVLGVAVLGLAFYVKLIESPADAVASFALYFQRAAPAVVLIMETLTTVWFFSVLITLFHQYREDMRPAGSKKVKTGLGCYLKRGTVLLCTAIVLLIFSETELGVSYLHQTDTKPEIVAHRGGAAFAPENTMAAVENAIAMGIDMVEIDVQQLKDGTLVLLHDSDFNRTTGNGKKVWEVGYDQVQTYDAGSCFSPKFAGEPVPRLDDILRRAKGNIQVMIELKQTGHEKHLAEQVVELIEKNEMLDQCSIGSLNLDILKEVKAVNPKIETVYITPLIFSGQYDMDFVDAFSVETTAITREMVATMQFQRKDVYGWTANSKETIQKNLECQVNGIVTDNPKLVKYCTAQTWESRLLDTALQVFFNDTTTQRGKYVTRS